MLVNENAILGVYIFATHDSLITVLSLSVTA